MESEYKKERVKRNGIVYGDLDDWSGLQSGKEQLRLISKSINL